MFWRKRTVLDESIESRAASSKQGLIDAAIGATNAAKDVTLQLKRSLDDTLHQLEVTSNLLSDALLTCDIHGKITSANQAAGKMFETDAKLMNGREIVDYFRADGKPVSFSYFLTLVNDQDLLINGRKTDAEQFNVECSITTLERSDGSTVLMFLVRDITTRVEIQKQLQLSEIKYRSAFENAYDGLMIVQNFHVVAVNPKAAKMVNRTTESIIATPALHYFAENFHEPFTISHEKYMNGCNKPLTLVTRCLGVDVMLHVTCMIWEGKPASLIGIKDVTSLTKKA